MKLSNRILNPSTGECLCVTGYFDDGSNACKPCSSLCMTCSDNANFCTGCSSELNRIIKTENKTCACKIGFYEDIYTLICMSCHRSCKACEGPKIVNCIEY